MKLSATFCMYFRQIAFALGESVAVNIITCLSIGELRKTSWMSLRVAARQSITPNQPSVSICRSHSSTTKNFS